MVLDFFGGVLRRRRALFCKLFHKSIMAIHIEKQKLRWQALEANPEVRRNRKVVEKATRFVETHRRGDTSFFFRSGQR